MEKSRVQSQSERYKQSKLFEEGSTGEKYDGTGMWLGSSRRRVGLIGRQKEKPNGASEITN